MAKSRKSKPFQLDIKTAFELDKNLREGLANAGLIPEKEARDIRDPDVMSGAYTVSLEIDAETAAAISQLLREGIITAAAAHQANNNSVATSVGQLLDKNV